MVADVSCPTVVWLCFLLVGNFFSRGSQNLRNAPIKFYLGRFPPSKRQTRSKITLAIFTAILQRTLLLQRLPRKRSRQRSYYCTNNTNTHTFSFNCLFEKTAVEALHYKQLQIFLKNNPHHFGNHHLSKQLK